MTRRNLLRAAAGAAAACAAPAKPAPQNAPQYKSKNALSVPLSQFDYSDVTLAPGPLEQQVRENHQLLLDLNEDSLLRPFRLREGLQAPGRDMGGWYNTYGFAPCEAFGQWVSALARFYRISGDAPAREKVQRLVRAYASTVEPSGKFYIENRFPAYVYDKIVLGLMDAQEYTGDPLAAAVLARATDAVEPFLPARAQPHYDGPVEHQEDFTRHCWDESYTLSENQFIAWERTGNERYRALGRRLLYDDFYFPLAAAQNVLPGKHAYSHVNSLSSAARAYLALNDGRYLNAARNGFAMVQAQSYATGGWGPDEHFFEPGSGHLGESLSTTHASFETPCGSYAHVKLTRYLLRITRDPLYGDSMERVLYNTVLGAKPLQSGGAAFYYSDYNLDGHKFYHPDKWPCCAGTLPQVVADYRISAFFRDPRGIYVNLYTPSTLRWVQNNSTYSLKLETDYPYDGAIRLTFDASHPETFSVFLRVPEWTGASPGNTARVTVTGAPGSRSLAPGTFFELRREWKRGDRIELELPLPVRLEPVDAQHPNLVALLSGPLVLMRILDAPAGNANLTTKNLLAATPVSSGSRDWTLPAAPGTRFRAFPDIGDERYSCYNQLA